MQDEGALEEAPLEDEVELAVFVFPPPELFVGEEATELEVPLPGFVLPLPELSVDEETSGFELPLPGLVLPLPGLVLPLPESFVGEVAAELEVSLLAPLTEVKRPAGNVVAEPIIELVEVVRGGRH